MNRIYRCLISVNFPLISTQKWCKILSDSAVHPWARLRGGDLSFPSTLATLALAPSSSYVTNSVQYRGNIRSENICHYFFSCQFEYSIYPVLASKPDILCQSKWHWYQINSSQCILSSVIGFHLILKESIRYQSFRMHRSSGILAFTLFIVW